MHRRASTLFALLAAGSLLATACSDDGTAAPAAGGAAGGTSGGATPAATVPPAGASIQGGADSPSPRPDGDPERPLKVALLTPAGPASLATAATDGAHAAVAEDGHVELAEIAAPTADETLTVVQKLCDDRYDLVVGVGPGFVEPLTTVAARCPTTSFLTSGAPVPAGPLGPAGQRRRLVAQRGRRRLPARRARRGGGGAGRPHRRRRYDRPGDRARHRRLRARAGRAQPRGHHGDPRRRGHPRRRPARRRDDLLPGRLRRHDGGLGRPARERDRVPGHAGRRPRRHPARPHRAVPRRLPPRAPAPLERRHVHLDDRERTGERGGRRLGHGDGRPRRRARAGGRRPDDGAAHGLGEAPRRVAAADPDVRPLFGGGRL